MEEDPWPPATQEAQAQIACPGQVTWQAGAVLPLAHVTDAH
jgi:hypothetical protein